MVLACRLSWHFACKAAGLGLLLLCVGTSRIEAHEGPPFPILMDQRVADFSISVWADPDIGDAVFYIVVETADGKTPKQPLEVSMWTEPVSGRLSPVTYTATRQNLRNRTQFEAKPYFDQGEMWKVGFRIKTTSGEIGDLITEVESTPPGYGPWDLAIYAFPFLLLGGMWIVAMLRRSRSTHEPPYEPTTHKLDAVSARADAPEN
jgi:hypothetical protein